MACMQFTIFVLNCQLPLLIFPDFLTGAQPMMPINPGRRCTPRALYISRRGLVEEYDVLSGDFISHIPTSYMIFVIA
jgi:hypothetical protein